MLAPKSKTTAAEDCDHRLLTVGGHDEVEFVESYLKENSLTALYDAVFIPVITAAEVDARQDSPAAPRSKNRRPRPRPNAMLP